MKKTISKDDFTTAVAEVIGDLLADEEMKEIGVPILMLGALFSSKLKKKLFDSNEELEIID